jgi:hypothetical protein
VDEISRNKQDTYSSVQEGSDIKYESKKSENTYSSIREESRDKSFESKKPKRPTNNPKPKEVVAKHKEVKDSIDYTDSFEEETS